MKLNTEGLFKMKRDFFIFLKVCHFFIHPRGEKERIRQIAKINTGVLSAMLKNISCNQ